MLKNKQHLGPKKESRIIYKPSKRFSIDHFRVPKSLTFKGYMQNLSGEK